MSRPSTRTCPEDIETMPHMTPISVVFPAPLGPSSAKISPLRISRLTASSATSPDAYFLETAITEIIGDITFLNAGSGKAPKTNLLRVHNMDGLVVQKRLRIFRAARV